jgi:predicted DNA-binding antitoxin AbrB/MazE fold protein
MAVSVRAVYKGGQLHLLEPVDLADGQTVTVTIGPAQESLSPAEVDERLRAAGLLLDLGDRAGAGELASEERRRIGARFAGERPSEDLVDEDRGAY